MLYQKIKIGEREYNMCAAASIHISYQNIFHEDFLKQIDLKQPETAVTPFMKMAFVMAKMGEFGRKKTDTLTPDDFADWLDEFSWGDMMNALETIEALYMKESVGTVSSKKN